MIRALLACFVLVFPATARAGTITVGAAVSLKEAMEDIGKNYQKETGDEVKFAFGASGTLEAQIRNGAPVDLFISAANEQVKNLIDARFADESTRRVIARNSLVLIVPTDKSKAPKDLTALKAEDFKRIAVGDPKVVPAGRYAAQSLKAARIDKDVADRLVLGTSVRQVLAYVERGEVDAGIVYATDAREAGDKVKVAANIDDSLHDPIEYPAVLLKNAPNAAGARRFVEYLASEKAQATLKAKGFQPPKPESKP